MVRILPWDWAAAGKSAMTAPTASFVLPMDLLYTYRDRRVRLKTPEAARSRAARRRATCSTAAREPMAADPPLKRPARLAEIVQEPVRAAFSWLRLTAPRPPWTADSP